MFGAAGAAAKVGRPGAKLGPWTFALAVVPILLGLAVLAELFATPAQSWMTRLVGQYSGDCLIIIPTLALGPLACLLFALRESAPARPGLARAVAGVAAGGVRAVSYGKSCSAASP